ncbi:MAG: trehalose-phosphatase [Candidatus Caenarcaniphilales bacterium]|jgi:trehalose 6-phosphate phosphatase|nr:trehalose-phosphatase [Candidatus Caenarcaniphilales bacterium]
MKLQIKLSAEKFIDLLKPQQKHLLIFDYDGTLTPLAKEHNQALLSDAQIAKINSLTKFENTLVAIVTGRSLTNLKSLLAGRLSDKVLLYGTHGAEIQQESSTSEHREILQAVRDKFADEPHVYFEDKPLSLTLHYREHPDRADLKMRLDQEAQKLATLFRVQLGHDVYEFLPKDINKGLAIKDLAVKHSEYYQTFFGDDLTDNFGFIEVNKLKCLSIQIGERIKEREAGYLIDSVEDTYKLIDAFIEFKNHVTN